MSFKWGRGLEKIAPGCIVGHDLNVPNGLATPLFSLQAAFAWLTDVEEEAFRRHHPFFLTSNLHKNLHVTRWGG